MDSFISLIIAIIYKSKKYPEDVTFFQQTLLANVTLQFSSYINRSLRRQRWNFLRERLCTLNVSLLKYSKLVLKIANANSLKCASSYISKYFFSPRQTGWQIHEQFMKPNNSMSHYKQCYSLSINIRIPWSMKKLAWYHLQLRTP